MHTSGGLPDIVWTCRIHNRSLRAVVLPESPWVIEAHGDKRRQLAGYSGPLIDAWEEILSNFQHVSTEAFDHAVISSAAREQVEGTWPAAIVDVATGAFACNSLTTPYQCR